VSDFGGETPISYQAISRYAADHGIAGEDLRIFTLYIRAIDAEWLVRPRPKSVK